MQVSLDAVEWEQLVGFGSAGEYLEFEFEGKANLARISCYKYMDWGDSAIQYFDVASVLEHLISAADPKTVNNLKVN